MLNDDWISLDLISKDPHSYGSDFLVYVAVALKIRRDLSEIGHSLLHISRFTKGLLN